MASRLCSAGRGCARSYAASSHDVKLCLRVVRPGNTAYRRIGSVALLRRHLLRTSRCLQEHASGSRSRRDFATRHAGGPARCPGRSSSPAHSQQRFARRCACRAAARRAGLRARRAQIPIRPRPRRSHGAPPCARRRRAHRRRTAPPPKQPKRAARLRARQPWTASRSACEHMASACHRNSPRQGSRRRASTPQAPPTSARTQDACTRRSACTKLGSTASCRCADRR